jgi:hypothetical protein
VAASAEDTAGVGSAGANPLLRAVARHPLAAFFGWFFTIGQAFAFTPVIAREVFGLDVMVQPFIVAATLVGLLLPALVITPCWRWRSTSLSSAPRRASRRPCSSPHWRRTCCCPSS